MAGDGVGITGTGAGGDGALVFSLAAARAARQPSLVVGLLALSSAVRSGAPVLVQSEGMGG